MTLHVRSRLSLSAARPTGISASAALGSENLVRTSGTCGLARAAEWA